MPPRCKKYWIAPPLRANHVSDLGEFADPRPGRPSNFVMRQSDELSEAIRLLEDFAAGSDPDSEFRRLGAAIDRLDQYAKDHPTLDDATRRLISTLRLSCTKRLLFLWPNFREHSIEPRLEYLRVLLLKMKPEIDAVLKESRAGLVLPRPIDGAVVEISPPGLTWLPIEGASHYRVEICNTSGAPAYTKTIGSEPGHLPDRTLSPGPYTWDVIALDRRGNQHARRGLHSFTIAEQSPELAWVEPETLLGRVPKEHPRFIYARQD